MGLFSKLFRGGKKKVSEVPGETRGAYMPDLAIPVDEKFTIYFKKNGGKFLYCDGFPDVQRALKNIIEENNWFNIPFFSLDKRLEERFSKETISFTNTLKESKVFFTTCEHLVAQNGSILVCSNQLKERKLDELPENFIVFATTSQLVNSIGEGLKKIKKKHQNAIPSNITTIEHFQNPKEEHNNDFLTYGSSSKNLYLILLEDL